MTSLYMYYAFCFVHVEHSVCHEPISVLIKIYIYIYICLQLLKKSTMENLVFCAVDESRWSYDGMLYDISTVSLWDLLIVPLINT